MIVMKPNEIYFLHLRYFDDSGRVLGKGGMTVAWKIVEDAEGEKKIKAGLSICSEKDNFCRKYGRNLAKGRVEEQFHHVNYMGRDLNGEIITSHRLREDIHNTLENWAYKDLA